MSVKAALAVLWACSIAGAAVTSESHRLCVLHTHTEMQHSHDAPEAVLDEPEVLIIAEYDVTN